MRQENILKNAKRWAKKNLLNEPLLCYWEDYQNYEEISFQDFKNLVLTGKKDSGNGVSITKNNKANPLMGIDTCHWISVEKEKMYAES